MIRNIKSFLIFATVLSIAFSSLGVRPVLASEKSREQQAVGAVVIGAATIIAALPVVATVWDAWTCRYETTNLRTYASSTVTYGTTYYYSSRSTYYYTAPARTFYLSRDTRMDGVLNKGLNNAIKNKTGIDVLSGTKYVPSRNYTFYTNRSVHSAYSAAKITKYMFDVHKKCGWWSDTLVLGSTWFIAPSSSTASYQYIY